MLPHSWAPRSTAVATPSGLGSSKQLWGKAPSHPWHLPRLAAWCWA